MDVVMGMVKRKSEITAGRVWLQVATVSGARVVRVHPDPLVANTFASVVDGMFVIAVGTTVAEPGPDGSERLVLEAAAVGPDLNASNVMVIDGSPRPHYLTSGLEITDTPDKGVQTVLIA